MVRSKSGEFSHRLDGAKTLVDNEINYQPQLVQEFFHQQYLQKSSSSRFQA